jgi:hypothetical protein
MEKELLRNFKLAEERTKYTDTLEEHYSEQDVRQIVREVLEELKSRNSNIKEL